MPGTGPIDAKAVIIGEAPANEELATGLPFQGPAGAELNDMLSTSGLQRGDIYITNTIKCALPYELEEKNKHPWARACMERHGEKELASLKPNAVALLGNVALSAYLHLSGITKYRGYVQISEAGIKMIPIIHPAATMRWDRSRKQRPTTRQDWRKFARLSTFEGPPDTGENFIINPTFDEVILFLNRVLKREMYAGYDIETTGLNIKDCTITCISIDDGERTICIPFWRDNGEPFWAKGELIQIVTLLSAIFANKRITKITTNGTFDESVLQLRGFIFRGPRLDTQYLHHVLFAELLHRLAFLGSVYTDASYWKDDVKGYDSANSSEDRDVDEVYWTYNCKDSHYQRQIIHKLVREASTRGKLEFYERIVAPVIPAIADMQATGINFDNEKRIEIAKQMEGDLAALEQKCFELHGGVFQIGSKQELAKIIFEEMGYTPQKFTPKQGRPAVDDDTVRWLYHHGTNEKDIEFFSYLTQYNKMYKLYSTYVTGEDVQPCSDGRIRASWKIQGTKTGRLACGQPNLMNVPDGSMREMYIPSPGRTFVYIDMDAFEAWIGALMAQDLAMIDILKSKKSPHLANAVVFQICATYEEAYELRKSGDTSFAQTYLALKNYFYGEQYGAEAKTIWQEMYARMDHPPSLATVSHWNTLHKAAHPAFATMRSEIVEQLRRTRLLKNGFGRERYHLGDPTSIITEGYNFPIQSTAADIMLQVQAQLFRELPETGIIVAQEHDALLNDVPNSYLPEFYKLAKDIFSQPFTFTAWHGETVTHSFDCGFKVGHNWGCLEEIKV